MSLKQYRAFYSVQCRRTYSDTWNMSCIFMSVIFSALPPMDKLVHQHHHHHQHHHQQQQQQLSLQQVQGLPTSDRHDRWSYLSQVWNRNLTLSSTGLWKVKFCSEERPLANAIALAYTARALTELFGSLDVTKTIIHSSRSCMWRRPFV